MRSEGLEPSHLSAHAPQTCVSTNSTTTALSRIELPVPLVVALENGKLSISNSLANYFFGASAGGLGGTFAAGAVAGTSFVAVGFESVGAASAGAVGAEMTEPPVSCIRSRARKKLVFKKMKAAIAVMRVRMFPAPRLPKMLWLVLPKPIPLSDFPG